MVVSRQIKDKLSSTPAGVILTIRDFGLEMRYQQALVKALSRLVQQGGLQRIAKGKYYVPKKTIFGMLKPTESELIKDYLGQNGKINKVVIEHKDRLTRFQYNLIELFFNSYGVEIELLDKNEYTEQEELFNDMMMLIASFSGRLYSARAKENAKKRKQEI